MWLWSCHSGFWGIQIFQLLGQHLNHCAFYRQDEVQTWEGLRPHCDCGDITWFTKRLRHCFLQNLSAACVSDGSEKFYWALSLVLCMYAHTRSSVCVYVCVHACACKSFANVMKLIVDPIFSLCYILDLTEQNRVLPDPVKVFQSKHPRSPQPKQWRTYADAECYPSGSACC